MLFRLLRVRIGIALIIIWHPSAVRIMRILRRRPLDQLDCHARFISLHHLRDLCRKSHTDPSLEQILPPPLVELAKPRKHHHGW